MAWGPRSRPDLPGGQSASSQQPHVCLGVRGYWQCRRTIQRLRRGHSFPVLCPGQARARPATQAWGWVCVGRGRRGERHPPKPSGEAQERPSTNLKL